MDRRGVTDGGSGRGDNYNAWYRNPSKIHKPGKKKIRRYMPHVSGTGRSVQLSKPDSPILSRIGYHSVERGASMHERGSAPLLRSGPMPPVGKMGGDGGSRYGGTSPTVYERDSLKRMEKGARLSNANFTGGGMSNGGEFESAAQQERGPVADSTGTSVGNVTHESPGGAFNSGNDTRAPAGGGGFRKVSTPSSSVKNTAEQGERENGTPQDVPEGVKLDHLRKSTSEQTPKCEKTAAHVGLPRDKYTSGTSDYVRQEPTAAVQQTGSSEERSMHPSEGSVNGPTVAPQISVNDVPHSKLNSFADRNVRSLPNRGNGARGPAVGSPKSSGEHNHVNRQLEKSTENESPKETEKEGQTNRARTSPRQAPPGTVSAKRERAVNHALANGDKDRLPAGSSSGKEENTLPTANRDLTPSLKAEVQKGRRSVSNDKRVTFKSHFVEKPPLSSLISNPTEAGKVATMGNNAKEPAKPHSSISTRQIPGSVPPEIPCIETNGGAAEIKEGGRAEFDDNSPSIKMENELQMSKQCKEQKSLDNSQHSEGCNENMVTLGVVSSAQLNAESERPRNAPALPVVELRTALSSKGGHPISATLKGHRSASLALLGLRSALNPPASNQPNGVAEPTAEPTTPVTRKSDKGSRQSPSQKDDVGSTPVPRSPVSVPLPALSFLRSSPRGRSRSSSVECIAAPQSLLGSPEQMQIGAEITPGNGTQEDEPASDERSKLVNQIYAFDERIEALKRQIAQKRITASNQPSADGAEKSASEKAALAVKDAQRQKLEVIAREIAEREEEAEDTLISPDPSYSSFRLLISRNKSVAAASRALLRPLCLDAEKGLSDVRVVKCEMLRSLPEGRRSKVAAEIMKRKAETLERRRHKWKEYRTLREAWERKLKLARDKRSKEKREMMKERDRFLVMCTKGQSALLSSRTSSGRMSTKIFPSLNANGQTNTNAEVDALLASIASEGGTPGLKDIWSKTLADIPVQNPSNIPCDSGSVWIEDPLQDFRASRAVNPWRFEEKLIFLDKFAMYPKNFRKIAGFLEHKTTQDCSAFYYQHKLDLGLKQLAKEASTMKRKGILKPHIVNLAKKRPTHDSEHVVASVIGAFLSSSHGSTGISNHDRPLSAGDSPSERKANDIQKGDLTNDRRKLLTANLSFKKRIISECGALDLSGITREAFLHALSNHGHNWHLVAREMALPGKTSSHYREFYKRNKRRLRLSDLDRAVLKSGSAKIPAATLRQSPIISPKSPPKPLPLPSEGEGGTATEADVMMLDTRADGHAGSKESMETSSPKELSPKPASSPGPNSPMDLDGRNAPGCVQTGHRGSAKTATWTKEERERFKQLFKIHKRDWKKIAQLLPPKTPAQVKGYWRKVAHEVGNGFPAHSGRISKSDRKRSRRAQSSDAAGIMDGKRHVERKSSPEKPPLGPSTEAGKNRTEESDKEHAGDTAKKLHLKKEEIPAQGEQKKLREPREGEYLSKRNGIDSNAHGEESAPEPKPSNDTSRSPEPGGSSDSLSGKVADGRLANSGRAPPLRSAPMPLLRSMPVKEVRGSISSGSGGGMRGGHESEKNCDGQKSKQDRLRRAAESYGVLELLDGAKGERLERGTR